MARPSLTVPSTMLNFDHQLFSLSNKNAFQWDAYRPLQWPSDWGGCLPRGVSAQWGCLPGGSARGDGHPPPVDRILDTRS